MILVGRCHRTPNMKIIYSPIFLGVAFFGSICHRTPNMKLIYGPIILGVAFFDSYKWISGFTIGFWISGFTMDFWIHDAF